MTKDVLISISGLQTTDGDTAEPVEIITPGIYYYKNGCHYVFYEEVQEGFEGVIKNRVRIRQDFMDIKREGVSNTHMVFEKGKKCLTWYETPLGCLLLGIDAKRFKMQETENKIALKVVYNLEINEQPISNCSVSITIASKTA